MALCPPTIKSHDVYEVACSYGNCNGTYASLNDMQFTGLATLSTSGSTPQILLAVMGASSTNKYFHCVYVERQLKFPTAL